MPQPNIPTNFEIFDHLPQGVFIVGRNGIVEFWNTCLEEWTGILKSRIIGSSLHVHFPHLTTPKYSSRFEPLFEGGAPATFASQFHPQFLPCYLPNGQPRIQQTIAKTIWNESSNQWNALVIIQDISNLHRQVAESQRLRKQAQSEIFERQKHQHLLDAIRQIESTYISTKNANQTFDEVLTQLLAISESEYGFIGEVRDKNGKPYLKTHAITNIAWNEETKALYDRYAPNMEFFNLQTLFGKVLTTKEAVISNSPYTDPRKGGLPEGHPPLNAFLGIPIFHGGQFLGMAGMGNREQGYDTKLVEYLQPLLASCGKILHAFLIEQDRQTTQIALEKSQERLSLATASAGMGIWDWDIPNNILTWDPTMFRLYGIPPEKFTGAYEAWSNGVHPDDRERAEQDLKLVLEGKQDFNTDFRVVWQDQSIHFIAARGNVKRDEKGNPIRMIGVNWDVTQQKQEEEDRLHLQRAIDQGVEGVALLDQNGHYTYINRAHAVMYGYTVDELLGQSWEILYSKNQLTYLQEHCLPELDNTGKWQGEIIGLRKDGTSFPIEISLSLLLQKDQRSAGLISSCRDITERRGAEEKFRLVVEASPSGMIMIDQQGTIVLANHLVTELFGYSREELLGLSIDTLVPKRFRTQHPTHRATFFASPKPQLMGSGRDLFGLRKDGSEFPVELGLNPLVTEKQTFVLASVVDITERKAAEKQIQKNANDLEEKNKELIITRDQALTAARSKSEFLATMSHEIRTPLNGVIGMTDLLLNSNLNSDQLEMVETVKHSGEFLLTIINDILDFSKIDAGKLDLEIINFDIRAALDEVLDILAERASQKNLELIGIVYGQTPWQLQGDPGRIRQILFNLIGNAIKFTEKGEIVVNVSLLETTSDTTTIQFSVTDTGIGISSHAQEGLFDTFTQADSSTTRKFGGTGLGLAICKKLVALMHGEIGVISERGQGSTFWFTIPFQHNSTAPTDPIPTVSLEGRRVCIVESNDTIRFLLQHYAQSWGMTCVVADNGSEGFALLTEYAKNGKPFDVAILDHTLSETIQEDGLSLAKQIRQNPSISQIPLVLLTALGKRGEGNLAREAGFNGYLTKPIRHQQLRKCLQMIVSSEKQIPSNDTLQASSLITRHTILEAQAQTQVHILLAEDNLVNQKVAVRMLHKIGYGVDVVNNGQEAVEAVEQKSYDLVLMDWQMPEMDGLEATRKIREKEKAKNEEKKQLASTISANKTHKHRLPIIAMTANALAGDQESCFEAGMDDFLTKPVGIETLQAMLTKWVTRPKGNENENPLKTNNPPKDSIALPPCLDQEIIKSLKSLDGEEGQEFFLSVIDQFLQDLPRHQEGIEQAVNHQDSEKLVKVAHTCKGSSRSMGAIALAEISYALELMGREERMVEAPATFLRWRKEMERTSQALQQEREHLTTSTGSSLLPKNP